MEDFEYSKEEQNALFEAIFLGVISLYNLPKGLYEQTAKVLLAGVYKGYVGTKLSFGFGSPDYELLKELTDNIYMFSGAKTATQVMDIQSLMFDEDGNKLTLGEFKKVAKARFDVYNGKKGSYLETEYKTATGQAQNAIRWQKIERDKQTFPWLKYKAESGACKICSPFNNVTLPVGNPFWARFMPLNHFGCNCEVKQIDRFERPDITPATKVNEITDNANKLMQPLFKSNPGIDKVIFNEKHQYFEIGKQNPELAKRNFNLPIPDEKQRKTGI